MYGGDGGPRRIEGIPRCEQRGLGEIFKSISSQLCLSSTEKSVAMGSHNLRSFVYLFTDRVVGWPSPLCLKYHISCPYCSRSDLIVWGSVSAV